MKTYGFIYLTTNTINGKQYFGQASYSTPYWQSYLGSGKAIKRAIRKYGKQAFQRQIIFDAFTEDDLTWAERYFIAEADAVKSKRFYNMTPGGRSSLGFAGKTHTEEHKQHMSNLLKGHAVSDDARKAASKIGNIYGKKNFAQEAQCPKCLKIGPIGSMKRWHFENCGIKQPASAETRERMRAAAKLRSNAPRLLQD